jgi:hypothetical protein
MLWGWVRGGILGVACVILSAGVVTVALGLACDSIFRMAGVRLPADVIAPTVGLVYDGFLFGLVWTARQHHNIY